MKREMGFGLGLCILAGLMPGVAWAQASDNSGAAAEAAGLDEIIVTAQRRSERLHDVPFTVTSQSGEDLAAAGIVSTKELSTRVPGLSFTTQGAFALPSLRGVTATYSGVGSESPIALYVDGVYYVNQVGSVFDLPDVDRVEVLKGPQGTLFGRNATAGAILIKTKNPQFDFSARISAQEGVYTGGSARDAGEFRTSAFITGPLSDSIAVSLSGAYSHTDGYLTNDVTGGRYGRREAAMVRGKILFQPHEGLRFLLSGFYSYDDDDINSSLQPLNGVTSVNGTRRVNGQLVRAWPDGVVPTQPWHVAGEMGGGSHIRTRSRGVSLSADWDIPGVGNLSSLTSYLYVKAEPTVDVDAAYSPSCVTAFSCVNFSVGSGPNKSFQQEVVLTTDKMGILSLTAGAFYYYDRGVQTQNVNFPFGANGTFDFSDLNVNGPVFGRGVINTEAFAVFGEATLDLSDRLHLVGGIRYSHEKKVSNSSRNNGANVLEQGQWDSWTPRLSVRYDITRNVNVYATFSKGFKSGVVPVNGSRGVTRPENLTSYEVGSKIGFSNLSLSVAGFLYDYKDLQVQFFDGVLTSLANASNARIYGIEADGTFEPVRGLRLRLAGAYVPEAEYREFTGAVDTDYWAPLNFYPQGTTVGAGGAIGPGGLRQVVGITASGQRLLKTPKFTGSASIDFDRETRLGRVASNVTFYHSSAYNWNLNGRVRTNAYNTLNASVSFTPPNSAFTFTVFGKNLTNSVYFTGAVLSNNADGVVYAPPRQIGVRAELSF